MGVRLGQLLESSKLELATLARKSIAIDASNALYQFLATIRLPSGEPLTDRAGNVTSHLVGLFNRTVRLLELRIRPVFVFDGSPPALKEAELAARKAAKLEAESAWKTALAAGRLGEARRLAARALWLTDPMLEEAKALISALGLPFVQAPGEADAQAALICARGEVWAVASQDFDCLLFGTLRLVRGLAIKAQLIELYELERELARLGLKREQLIAVALLIGTDYHSGGVPGMGPARALALVRKQRELEAIFRAVNWSSHFDFDWRVPFELFTKPAVSLDYELEWRPPDRQALLELLCDRHDFVRARVEAALSRLGKGLAA